VDGNTDEKAVQKKFIGTLMEMMKGENFPVYQRDDNDDGTILEDLEGQAPDEGITTVAGPAVPRLNGHIPNSDVRNEAENKGQHLRYNVRNMYAQIGSYPNDSVL